MKRLLFLFSFFAAVLTFAQNSITGKITDEDGKPIPSASVTVEEVGKDAIIAFSITNSKGEYKVTFTTNDPNVDLKVKAFNQKPLTRTVKNQNQNLDFKLESDATEIKEVKLKSKMITKRGDTITYDLKAFESKADRTLADVLKKIPGIEVNKDGSILYQGEPINKFYVNGKDLMEGGYGTINNSLPKDAVQKVEVMENHQPVKILQDKVPSENAAINVKLKNSVTMTGRGEVGAGFDPMLWNVKLTPMFFSQKNQWVVNYKANNTGETVEKEGNLLSFGSRFEGRRRQSSQNNWINVESASTPNLPEKRYLMNNVHFFSANVLTNPFKNKEWEFKASANYSNNAISRDSYQETVYSPSNIFPNGMTVSQEISNKFYSNASKAEMIFTKNAKKGFFKNTTTWNGFWKADRADAHRIELTRERSATESMESPTGSFQNSLSTIIPWKEKLVNFMSYFNYQKDRQSLNVTPGSYFDPFIFPEAGIYGQIRQDISTRVMDVNHSASVGFTYKKWTITPEVGLNLNFNNMDSQIFGTEQNGFNSLGDKFRNDMHWNQIQPYSQVGFNYKGSSINFNLTLPLNFYGMDYQDNVRNISREISKTVLEPTMFMSYDFASFYKLWVFGSINYNFGNFGSLYGGYLLTNPSSIGIRNSPLPENISRNIGSRLEYRNPLNNLFFNVAYNFGNSTNNLITSTTITPGTSLTDIIEYKNSPVSQMERAEIGKYFPKFKSNVSTSFINRDTNNFRLLNGNIIESKNNGQTFGFKFNNTYFSWMSVDYNLSMNWNKNKNLYDNSEFKSSGWNHNLALFVYPIENHTIGFNWDDISSKTLNDSYRNSFYDLSYQYTWSKKKIDFEVKWLNIANKKLYEVVSVDAATNSVSRTSINIRPSQVMFTVKFNFK
ncbi:Plug and carboxypeptidase regulatory-like domain-containing protein [Chryseobacterium suipulveris]|uniref:Plug and carboxypeptidase regulatory-like domain-containing protein n=1 Tax=Chryseobacterium suipulveris TaxID=2929800 RepID=A0ABY4BX10_9FLAO|nr:carboxypeptidase regulatory-like domain-containing protein [Chryseobacterium suipulveris]UOE41065.1 Plug and carboxypeptidase regulatory-like domain-containing protein [Chryseobacterium suipulveris]